MTEKERLEILALSLKLQAELAEIKTKILSLENMILKGEHVKLKASE